VAFVFPSELRDVLGFGMPPKHSFHILFTEEYPSPLVDSAFSDVVDGLVLVDLMKVSRPKLEKYRQKTSHVTNVFSAAAGL
jgi:hypothetical protein